MSRVLRVGIDLVMTSRIAESIATFGEKFLTRVFTSRELDYARDYPERLAARFAAKEAAKKALRLDGVGWRDFEVYRHDSGAVDLVLHGAARDAVGPCELALSLSHEGDLATAVVVANMP